MTKKHVLRPAALAAVLCGLALPALAIQGGTPTTGFAAVGQGVQVTEDWVLTVGHYTLSPGQTYTNGFGTRVVAALYVAPGFGYAGDVPSNDVALMRLVPLATTATFVSVLGETVPYGTFPGFAATITSASNTTGPRAYGFTSITESVATADPDDAGPLGQVPVNWLVSNDPSVYVQNGDSGGGLFLGHVTDTSVLLGLSSVQFGDANGPPSGSGFVQPAAYRSWLDQAMLADGADSQFIHWTTVAVPEPASWALWGAGLAGLLTAAGKRAAATGDAERRRLPGNAVHGGRGPDRSLRRHRPLQSYRAPRWLPGGNLQTIWSARLSRRHPGAAPRFVRERWTTPDGDFIDVDHLDTATPTATAGRRLVLFHGLEGSSDSQYAQAFAVVAQQRGWAYTVPHFRGCSGEINLAPRAYHSGDFEEIGWILQRLRIASAAPLLVVGISLGGNALLRWAEESGAGAAAIAGAVAAVCSPVDLAAAGAAIDRGFNRLVYAQMFLRTMKPRALAKLQQHPGLFDRERLAAARTLFAFDDVFTAPLHGFRGTHDYWRRASAKPALADVRIPALVLNAGNDPFVPAASLPRAHEAGRWVTLWQPAHGGHVGFAVGPPPGHVLSMPQAVAGWLAEHG